MSNKDYQAQRIKDAPDSLLGRMAALLLDEAGDGVALPASRGNVWTVGLMLCDIRHLCDVCGLDYAECDRLGYEGYLEELEFAKNTDGNGAIQHVASLNEPGNPGCLCPACSSLIAGSKAAATRSANT